MTIAERQQIADATEACRVLTVQLADVLTRLTALDVRLTFLEEVATAPPSGKHKAR